MSTDLADSFTKLLGRQPTDKEVQEFYRIRDALGLKNNDALWLILMTFQTYQTKFDLYPAMIEEAAKTMLIGFVETAEITIKASGEKTKADLAQAVAIAARDVASHTSKRLMWQWFGVCIFAAFVSFSVFGYYIHKIANEDGYNSGVAVGYKEGQEEKAAAAWGNTPDGKMAYRLAKSGELAKIVKCDRKGWEIKKGFCFPHAVDGAVHGWKLP